jgi:hypothetical protein
VYSAYEPEPPVATAVRVVVWPESIDVGAIETDRVGLMVTVTAVVAVPPRESVTWTQKAVVEVREAEV